VTRSDFDGLAGAVLLKKLDLIGEIKLVHPEDRPDGKVPVTDRDIGTNPPYVDGVHLASGTCQVENERAEAVLGELIRQIHADG
jgi:hypothetical protein